jgi:proteasome accessory factor B
VKDDAWEKYERQLKLLAALRHTRRPLRLWEILAEVPGYDGVYETGRRKFNRDKDELLALGVPIRTVEGSSAEETGYLIEDGDYEFPALDLEPEELAALHMALRTISIGIEDDQVDRVLWRLGGIVESEAATESVGQVLGGLGGLPAPPELLRMVRAVADRRVVTFEYEPSTGDAGTRVVEPWFVHFERGRWYLRGFDRDRGGPRHYRFDRILGPVKVTNDTATRSPEKEQPGTDDPWEYGEGEPVMVDLWVDHVLAPQLAPQLAPYDSRPGDAGGTVWTLGVTNWPAFRSFALAHLERAEVLAPPQARADMIEWLEAIVGDEED